MDKDLAILNQKIDSLTSQVEILTTRQVNLDASGNGADLRILSGKINYLTEQFEEQQRRQQAFDELKDDMIPIVNHMIKLSIDELAEIGNDFELEDLFFMLKRLLRNTHLLMTMMDRLEAMMDLADEAQILGKQMFSSTIEQLDQLEQQGYFAFAREGWGIMERIVNEFSEEDVRALGDNIVTILGTVRNMTQPEILALANNAVGAIREAPRDAKPPSTLALLRELSDPKVRKGLGRMLNIMRALADQPESRNNN